MTEEEKLEQTKDMVAEASKFADTYLEGHTMAIVNHNDILDMFVAGYEAAKKHYGIVQ